MTAYIAILRGINVSGQKKIKMADLRELLADSGLEDLQTYIQSGNIVFKSNEKDESVLSKLIHDKIQDKYGFEVPVIIRSSEAWQNAIKRNPYAQKKGIDLARIYVTFLDNKPDSSLVNSLKSMDFSPEEFVIDGLEVYLHCPNGYGRTKLNNNFFENKLKVPATTRNWKTVNALLQMVKR